MRVAPRLIHVRSLVPEIPLRTYATHGIDKYPAKMLPHLARYAIEVVSKPGDRVFDPFCGCGTVLVEASMTDRRSVGMDVNPIAVLLARAKSGVFRTQHFTSLVEEVIAAAMVDVDQATPTETDSPKWLPYWFSKKTLAKLLALQRQISLRSTLSAKYRDLLTACLIIAVRRCSRADPRSPKPFISKRARACRVGKHFDAFQVYRSVARRLVKASNDFRGLRVGKSDAVAMMGDSRFVTRRDIGTVDAVVTSPPYLSAQDYYRSSKLELAISGYWQPQLERTLGAKIIGSGRGEVLTPRLSRRRDTYHRSCLVSVPDLSERARAVVHNYLSDMRRMLQRTHGCLRLGGQCCMVIGDSKIEGVALPVHAWIIGVAKSVGLKLVRHDVDLIQDRRLPPQREGHASVIDREHLLFLKK